MRTRNVVITDHQAELIEELVASGQYQNASEVLRDGLRLIEERAAAHKAKLKALREAIRVGDADFEAGRYKDFHSSADLRRHLRGIAQEVLRSPTRKRGK